MDTGSDDDKSEGEEEGLKNKELETITVPKRTKKPSRKYLPGNERTDLIIAFELQTPDPFEPKNIIPNALKALQRYTSDPDKSSQIDGLGKFMSEQREFFPLTKLVLPVFFKKYARLSVKTEVMLLADPAIFLNDMWNKIVGPKNRVGDFFKGIRMDDIPDQAYVTLFEPKYEMCHPDLVKVIEIMDVIPIMDHSNAKKTIEHLFDWVHHPLSPELSLFGLVLANNKNEPDKADDITTKIFMLLEIMIIMYFYAHYIFKNYTDNLLEYWKLALSQRQDTEEKLMRDVPPKWWKDRPKTPGERFTRKYLKTIEPAAPIPEPPPLENYEPWLWNQMENDRLLLEEKIRTETKTERELRLEELMEDMELSEAYPLTQNERNLVTSEEQWKRASILYIGYKMRILVADLHGLLRYQYESEMLRLPKDRIEKEIEKRVRNANEDYSTIASLYKAPGLQLDRNTTKVIKYMKSVYHSILDNQ